MEESRGTSWNTKATRKHPQEEYGWTIFGERASIVETCLRVMIDLWERDLKGGNFRSKHGGNFRPKQVGFLRQQGGYFRPKWGNLTQVGKQYVHKIISNFGGNEEDDTSSYKDSDKNDEESQTETNDHDETAEVKMIQDLEESYLNDDIDLINSI